MIRNILQIPISSDLRYKAELEAQNMGFSSIQEVVRVILTKIANKKLSFYIDDNSMPLGARAIARYEKMDEDFKNNRNVYTANSAKDLISQLNENKIQKSISKKLPKKNKIK